MITKTGFMYAIGKILQTANIFSLFEFLFCKYQHVSLHMFIILHARSILLKDCNDLIRLSINIEYKNSEKVM